MMSLAALVSIATLALFVFWSPTRNTPLPAEDSAEAGFARDMAEHHAQAVEMAVLLRDRSDDEAMRLMALDILLTQQAQIGQMQGWLAIWDVPFARLEPAMTWMGMPTTDRMPGMASQAEMKKLRDLSKVEAEVLFLQLMIPHHRAGLTMAQAILEQTKQPEVRALAQSIVNAQQSEIDAMQIMLQERGQPLVPDEPKMNHG